MPEPRGTYIDFWRLCNRIGSTAGGHMGIGRRLSAALRSLLRKRQVEAELELELQGYVDAVADENARCGLSPSEARRQALAEFGGVEQVKQAVRDQRASTLVESIVQDIHYGL